MGAASHSWGKVCRVYSKSASAGTAGRSEAKSISSSMVAMTGRTGARFSAVIISIEISSKVASEGTTGARIVKVATSSKVASDGVAGARVIVIFSLDTGAVGNSFPAKRTFTERVRIAAIMIVVVFILLFEVDEAKIDRSDGAEQ